MQPRCVHGAAAATHSACQAREARGCWPAVRQPHAAHAALPPHSHRHQPRGFGAASPSLAAGAGAGVAAAFIAACAAACCAACREPYAGRRGGATPAGSGLTKRYGSVGSCPGSAAMQSRSSRSRGRKLSRGEPANSPSIASSRRSLQRCGRSGTSAGEGGMLCGAARRQERDQAQPPAAARAGAQRRRTRRREIKA